MSFGWVSSCILLYCSGRWLQSCPETGWGWGFLTDSKQWLGSERCFSVSLRPDISPSEWNWSTLSHNKHWPSSIMRSSKKSTVWSPSTSTKAYPRSHRSGLFLIKAKEYVNYFTHKILDEVSHITPEQSQEQLFVSNLYLSCSRLHKTVNCPDLSIKYCITNEKDFLFSKGLLYCGLVNTF